MRWLLQTAAAIKLGIKVILCVGESLEVREAGKTTEVVSKQLEEVHKVLKDEDWA